MCSSYRLTSLTSQERQWPPKVFLVIPERLRDDVCWCLCVFPSWSGGQFEVTLRTQGLPVQDRSIVQPLVFIFSSQVSRSRQPHTQRQEDKQRHRVDNCSEVLNLTCFLELARVQHPASSVCSCTYLLVHGMIFLSPLLLSCCWLSHISVLHRKRAGTFQGAELRKTT